AIVDAGKPGPTLVVVGRRHEVWIARIDGDAAWQQGVGEGRTSVILQRTKHWFGVDLVARGRQIASAAVNIVHAAVAAKVVAERVDRALVNDVFARSASLEDGVCNRKRREAIVVPDAASGGGRVATEGAVGDRHRRRAGVTFVEDAAAGPSPVTTEGAVGDRHRRAAGESVIEDAAAPRRGRVGAEGAVV